MRVPQISKPLLGCFMASMLISGIALGAESASAAPPEPSKETRAKMATMHEQMATCLRSDRSFSDCRSEMMKGCKETMSDYGCPMMWVGRRHQMMRQPSTPAPKNE